LLATLGYMLAGWQMMDAVYMVIITIFGVGYGEVHPIESFALRLMTICLIVFGYGAAIYTVGGLVQMVMEGELNKALSRRRMSKEIEELANHAIVCGFGRAGKILSAELHAIGTPFVVVDQDDEKLTAAELLGFLVLEGNATEDETLIRAGIERARVLATVLPDDSANVFITLTARELNPLLEIIARAENPSSEKKLLRSGATQVVLPAVIGGKRMAQLITRPSTEKLLADESTNSQLHHELSLIGLEMHEVPIDTSSALNGATIGEVVPLDGARFLIVAVRRSDGEMVVEPGPGDKLLAGDALVVLASGKNRPQLTVRPKSGGEITYRGARLTVTG
jgi:voltage-gated potassium channel